MSDQIISLTSSDEEDNAEPPPPKKRKVTPSLPECTLTLVSTNPTESAIKSKTIVTVSLDSDDEVCEDKNDLPKEISTNSIGNVKKTFKSTDSVDLISLTDDDEDDSIQQPNSKVTKINGANKLNKNVPRSDFSLPQEPVSIDDSDSEASQESGSLVEKEKRGANIKRSKTIKEKHNNSIIIDDSDDETEKENHCENEPNETFPVHIEKTSANDVACASTSKDELEEAKELFKKFVRIIEEKIVDSSFEEILPKKVPIIKKYFNRSGAYVNDQAFKTLLRESIEGMRKSSTANGANSAVLAFHKVFEHLKLHMAQTTIIVEEDNLPKIKKLEQTIKLLRKRIHQLEVAEVDFDDDEDSAYIMLDRYQARLNKVYTKYCQYINRNPYSGRATYDRISFVNSSYNEINQALTRKYRNSLVFPSYYELENFIRKISTKNKLDLSEAEIKIESKKCFKVLGSILQKKRRQELYDSHLDFVEHSEDPATKDISLENVLKKNYAEGKEKIDKLYQKYVNKQEKGEDHVSTDGEDSDDEDNRNKKGKAKKINNGKKQSKTKDDKKENSANENEDKHNNNQLEVTKDREKSEEQNLDLKNDIRTETMENKDKKESKEHTPKKKDIETEKGKDQQEQSIKHMENEREVGKEETQLEKKIVGIQYEEVKF